MSTNYPPGTVALVADPVEGERVAIFIGGGGDQPCWHMADGDGVLRCLAADAAESVRPLVVIDPEDREQVEHLIRAQIGTRSGCPDVLKVSDAQITRQQAALRSLIASPKPAEPTGLGAVVEDAEGRRWVRSKHITTVCHWKPAAGGRRVRWSDLPASVRILSEGVQA